jgi:hypothetical protein
MFKPLVIFSFILFFSCKCSPTNETVYLIDEEVENPNSYLNFINCFEKKEIPFDFSTDNFNHCYYNSCCNDSISGNFLGLDMLMENIVNHTYDSDSIWLVKNIKHNTNFLEKKDCEWYSVYPLYYIEGEENDLFIIEEFIRISYEGDEQRYLWGIEFSKSGGLKSIQKIGSFYSDTYKNWLDIEELEVNNDWHRKTESEVIAINISINKICEMTIFSILETEFQGIIEIDTLSIKKSTFQL